jgi:hypothetical protein
MSGFQHFFAAAMVLGAVDTLSDDDGPKKVHGGGSSTEVKPKGPKEPKEPKGKGKGKGKKSSEKAVKSKTEQKKAGNKQRKEPTPEDTEEPKLKPMKRPAASASAASAAEPAKKKPAGKKKELTVYKCLYKTGSWGFKVNGKQVMSVPR